MGAVGERERSGEEISNFRFEREKGQERNRDCCRVPHSAQREPKRRDWRGRGVWLLRNEKSKVGRKAYPSHKPGRMAHPNP